MSARPVLQVVAWRHGYRRAWLWKDVLGGLAAGAVVIPQAMAYATIAGLHPEVGLYTCMVPMAVYALLGGSRTLSVSTTSTIAVLTGSTLLAAGIAAGSEDPARTLATLTLLVGGLLVVARLLHLAVLIDNVSEATLTGIKVGVGLTVAAGQLPALLGIPGDPTADDFFSEIRAAIDHLGDISWATTVFSALTIAGLIALKRLAPKVPGPLAAVAAGILLVSVASIDEHGVALIAPVPSGLPTPVAPTLHAATDLIPGALAIAIMVFLETLAVGRAVRRSHEPPIDNDQELLVSGLASAVGACFRAMPSAGGFSQTAINQRAGARTQLSELVTVALSVSCALFLGGVLSNLPEATLASLVVLAVLGLIVPSEFAVLWRVSRLEFWVAAVTTASGLVLGLLPAVVVGVVLTLFLVIVELDRIGVTELGPTDGDADLVAVGAGARQVPGLLVLRFDGPLYTANVRSANRKVLDRVDASAGVEVLVLDTSAVSQLSVTVIHEAVELERELDQRGVALWIAGLPPRALAMAKLMPRWDELDRSGRLHPSALAATRAFRAGGAPSTEGPTRDG